MNVHRELWNRFIDISYNTQRQKMESGADHRFKTGGRRCKCVRHTKTHSYGLTPPPAFWGSYNRGGSREGADSEGPPWGGGGGGGFMTFS